MIKEASYVQLRPKTIFKLLQIYTPHPLATKINTTHVNSFSNIIYTSNKTNNHAKERIPKQLLGVENSKVHTNAFTHINNKHKGKSFTLTYMIIKHHHPKKFHLQAQN